MRSDFGRLLERALNERLKAEKDYLASDRATSFEDYRRRCGLIQGLTFALEEAAEVDRKLMSEEERL